MNPLVKLTTGSDMIKLVISSEFNSTPFVPQSSVISFADDANTKVGIVSADTVISAIPAKSSLLLPLMEIALIVPVPFNCNLIAPPTFLNLSL